MKTFAIANITDFRRKRIEAGTNCRYCLARTELARVCFWCKVPVCPRCNSCECDALADMADDDDQGDEAS